MSRDKSGSEDFMNAIFEIAFGIASLIFLKVPFKFFKFGREVGMSSRASSGGAILLFVILMSVVPSFLILNGDIDFTDERRINRSFKRSVSSSSENKLWGAFFEFLIGSYGVGYLVGVFSYTNRRGCKNNLGKSEDLLGSFGFLNERDVEESILENHQLVLGASGAGKTFYVLEGQVRDAIERGERVFIIDPKGDVKFRDAVYSWCRHFGREDDFRYFSMSEPSNSDHINPFGDCRPNEIKDMIISATDWSEPHYRKMAEVSIMKVLLGRDLDSKVSISEIIRLLPETKELVGLRADLELMKLSEYGALIDDGHAPSIFDYYADNRVVFVSLDVQAYPQASVQLGRILMGSILSLSNRVQSMPDESRFKTTIVVDEFGSFLTDSFVNFINKARSSNFRAILATQSVGDLERYSVEMRKQLMDSITNKVVLRMSDPDSIEFCSRMFGTKSGKEVTRQIKDDFIFGDSTTGMGSEKEVEKFIVHPKDIRELSVGDGFILVQSPYRVFRVNFYNPRLEGFEEVGFVCNRQDQDDGDAWEGSSSLGFSPEILAKVDTSLESRI